jgi:hypothetical protein
MTEAIRHHKKRSSQRRVAVHFSDIGGGHNIPIRRIGTNKYSDIVIGVLQVIQGNSYAIKIEPTI